MLFIYVSSYSCLRFVWFFTYTYEFIGGYIDMTSVIMDLFGFVATLLWNLGSSVIFTYFCHISFDKNKYNLK
jgi:hypothetical protein